VALTKPDRIDPGDEGKWLDMLWNHTEEFKQPGSNLLQARITLKEVRKHERYFIGGPPIVHPKSPDYEPGFWYHGLGEGPESEVIARGFVDSSLLTFSVDLPLSLLEVENELHQILKEVHTLMYTFGIQGRKGPSD